MAINSHFTKIIAFLISLIALNANTYEIEGEYRLDQASIFLEYSSEKASYRLTDFDVTETGYMCDKSHYIELCILFDTIDIIIPKDLRGGVILDHKGIIITVRKGLDAKIQFEHAENLYHLTVVRPEWIEIKGNKYRTGYQPRTFELIVDKQLGLLAFRESPGGYFVLDDASLMQRELK